MQAFKPRKFIFVHCCANCEYGKKLMEDHGSSLNYICMKDTSGQIRRLPGAHNCDVDTEDNSQQISIFDQLPKED